MPNELVSVSILWKSRSCSAPIQEVRTAQQTSLKPRKIAVAGNTVSYAHSHVKIKLRKFTPCPACIRRVAGTSLEKTKACSELPSHSCRFSEPESALRSNEVSQVQAASGGQMFLNQNQTRDWPFFSLKCHFLGVAVYGIFGGGGGTESKENTSAAATLPKMLWTVRKHRLRVASQES